MAGQYLPYPADYDLEAELADERYARALKRITVDEVLSEVDSLIARESGFRKHPLHALATRVLRHGGFRSSGKRAAVYEELIEQAIATLAQEELANFGPWEDER